MPITKSHMKSYYKRATVSGVEKSGFTINYICDSLSLAQSFSSAMEDALAQTPRFNVAATWNYKGGYFNVQAVFSNAPQPTALGNVMRQVMPSEWKGLTSKLEQAGIIPYVLKAEIDQRVNQLNPSAHRGRP